jgi:ribosomal protein S27AE
MPRLACRACGKSIWATVPLIMLFAEERRCPRCGSTLDDDRRATERRFWVRRQKNRGAPEGEERRSAERREAQRRQRQA